MSYYVGTVLTADRFATPHVRRHTVTTYDEFVQAISGLVSYWKFAGGGTTAFDQRNIVNALYTGQPETNVPTIVRNDTIVEGAPTDGLAIAWPGTTGDFATAAHNALHKTAQITVVVTFQRDTANERGVLIASNQTVPTRAGEFEMVVNINGSIQAVMRDAAGVAISLMGPAADVTLNRAFFMAFRAGGPSGMSLRLYNDSGVLIRNLINTTMTTGAELGLSPIRFGSNFADSQHWDGPFARVAWYNRQLTDAELLTLAKAKTINRNPVQPGSEFFISTTGSDVNNGSISTPWRTLAHADDSVGPGSTITLLPGTYDEANITLLASGTPGNPITWKSQVRHGAIIRPINGQTERILIFIDGDYVHLDGLQLDGSPYPELHQGILNDGEHGEVRNCYVHHVRALGTTDGGAGIGMAAFTNGEYAGVDSKVYNCKVHDIGDLVIPSSLVHGIYISHNDAQVFNNLVYRIEGGGIHLWHRASIVHVHNNTIFDCGDSGMILGHDPEEIGDLSNTKVTNNIVIDCPFGIRTSGAQGTGNEARNNTNFQCTTATSIAGTWTVSGGLTSNPLFVNYQISGSGDYHLTASSPAIDSGFATYAPTFDYDNGPRPLGSPAVVDRGIYETAAPAGGGGAVSGLADFTDATTYYTIPQNAALNHPAGAWAWGVWVQLSNNTGAFFQHLISTGVPPASPSFGLYCVELSNASETPNRWSLRVTDDAGANSSNLDANVSNAGDGVKRLIVAQSTGATLEIWFCEENGTATRVRNTAFNTGVLTAPTVWNFGRRSDGNADRWYDGLAGGLFKADVALTQANVEAIAAGSSPVTVLGAGCIEFWPFLNGNVATETGVVAGIVATRVGP